MNRHILWTLVAATGAFACTGAATAQHADFVVFGESNEEAMSIEASRRHVHPISAPYFHEDSFVTSDVRAWGLYHNFPDASAIGGGDAKVGAVQLRLALTEEFQFVAYKDGYANFNSGAVDADGLMDIGAGLKFNFIHDWQNDFHMAVGLGYELKTGHGRILQNDDEWRLWLSANKGFGRLHLGATVNVFLADEKNVGVGNSDHLSWHLHADYHLCDWFSPVVEFNGYTVLEDGAQVLPFQGLDVANLGNGKGEDVVTVALGGEFRPAARWALRAAYETPLTHADDLFGYRWTFSVVFSF